MSNYSKAGDKRTLRHFFVEMSDGAEAGQAFDEPKWQEPTVGSAGGTGPTPGAECFPLQRSCVPDECPSNVEAQNRCVFVVVPGLSP